MKRVSMPNLTPRDRRAITWGAAILVPSLAWVLIVSPYLGAVREAGDRLEQDRALLRRELALLSESSDYKRAFDDGAEKLLAAAPRLMGGDDDGAASAAVAGYLRSVARMGGAHVTRVEPAASRDAGGGITALPVAVIGESDLEGLLTFLHMLETGPKLVDVADLKIESAGSGAPVAAGAAYAATPFYTPSGAPAAQPEVISFRFTATGFTLAQPARRGGDASESDADAEETAEDEETDAGSETEADAARTEGEG